MILDTIDNSACSEELNPRFKKAFGFVKEFDFSSAVPGRIEIDGDDIFAMISEFDGKLASDAKLETHQKYIDIQIPLMAKEMIGWRCASSLTLPLGDHDTENDIRFYEDEPTSYVSVSPGEFIMLFPHDAHAPGIAFSKIKKMIIKVKV